MIRSPTLRSAPSKSIRTRPRLHRRGVGALRAAGGVQGLVSHLRDFAASRRAWPVCANWASTARRSPAVARYADLALYRRMASWCATRDAGRSLPRPGRHSRRVGAGHRHRSLPGRHVDYDVLPDFAGQQRLIPQASAWKPFNVTTPERDIAHRLPSVDRWQPGSGRRSDGDLAGERNDRSGHT